MAELGDLLTGGSRVEDVSIEMMDYDFLDECTDHGLIRAIVLKLKSGEEGHYPQLLKHAETRLLQELPQAERSKILRMKAEPQPDEIYEAASDLHAWEEAIAKLSSKTKINERSCLQQNDQNAPKWTSCDQAETESRTPKVVELASHDDSSHGDRTQLTGVGPERTGAKKLDAYDFRAWENYDADEEIRRMENDEKEQQTMEHEAIESAKVRTEQDQQRRAKLREDQLREAGEGRFKESLSSFEKKRTSAREHLKGNESFKAKEYDESFRCYSLAIALDDANAKLYNNRAAAAHKLQRFEQAEDDCTRAIYLDAEFKRAWMRRGMVRYSRGKYAGAVTDFAESVRLDPNDIKAFKLRELTAAKQRQVEGDPVGKTNGGPPKKRGRLLIEEVDTPQEREVDFEELDFEDLTPAILAAPPPVVENKRTMIAHGWMEVVSEDLKRSGTRIQVLDSVDQQVPRRVMVSYDSSDEDYNDAAKHAGIILVDTDKDRVDAVVAKARALYNAGDYDAARIAFLQAQEYEPLAPGRWKHANNASACMLRLGDNEATLDYTKRVLAVDPLNEKAMYRQWLALERLGKSDEGDSALLLSRLAPSDEMNGETATHINAVAADEEKRQEKCDELRQLGNDLMRTGRQDEAVGMYTAALEENPSDTRASNNRAQAYLNLKRYADAEKDATVVLQADPGNIKASYRRGRARLNLPRPDKEGGCTDLARVVSKNPKNQNEAIDCLAQAVEGMDLDFDGGDVFPEEDNYSKMPEEESAKSYDETPTGSGTSGFEIAVEDTEVATQPSTKRRPGSLVIVEDDEDGGCSWCPLVVEERKEDSQASIVYWKKGEHLRGIKRWEDALELFSRGVAANPSDAKCWIGLSRVHREQGNYKDSSEAAIRVQKVAPTSAILCKAVTRLTECKEFTELERINYARSVWLELDALPSDSTVGSDLQEWECAEEWAILTAILPQAEIDARH